MSWDRPTRPSLEADGGSVARLVASSSALSLLPPPSFPDTTLHPPPSLLPAKKYCDITGLEAPYRDPKTGLQFHSKEIYGVIRTLVGPYLVSLDLAHRLTLAPVCFSLTPQPPGVDQQYLMLRGRGSAIV